MSETYNIFRKELENLKVYVPGKPIEEVMKEYGLTEIAKLASNENPLGPSPKAIEAIQKEATGIHIYPDGVAADLTAKLADKYGIGQDQVMMGNGGEQILFLIAQTFINEGDEAIMANPSFALYDITVTLMGGKPVVLPLTSDFKHDFKGFVNAVTDKTKLVYVCNPNNPTGNIMTKEEVYYLADHLPEHVVLVLDEAYFEYAIRNENYIDGLELLEKRPNTVILRTFSKVAGLAGLRVGYCMSSPEIITEMKKIKGVFNSNRIAQKAAIASLDDQEHIDKTVDLNYKTLDTMIKYFESKNLSYVPSNTNFIFVNVGKDSRMVFTELMKRGVVIRPGFLWGFDEYIRVSTGTEEQIDKFINALDEILNM